jgi:hypothetical protein
MAMVLPDREVMLLDAEQLITISSRRRSSCF